MSVSEAIKAETIQPWPLVRRGDSEHPVRTLQYLLRARRETVAADGIFGPRTESAVRAFQGEHGLAVDGRVGTNTWMALVVQVQRGSRGDAVRGVQTEFAFRDLSGGAAIPIAVDGIFGPRTERLVTGFQDALGLAADGIVGPLTWRALVSGMLSG